MWGLHIMDPGGREDTPQPVDHRLRPGRLISTLLAIILLPMVTETSAKGRTSQRWSEPWREVAGEDLHRPPLAQLDAGVAVVAVRREPQSLVQRHAGRIRAK